METTLFTAEEMRWLFAAGLVLGALIGAGMEALRAHLLRAHLLRAHAALDDWAYRPLPLPREPRKRRNRRVLRVEDVQASMDRERTRS